MAARPPVRPGRLRRRLTVAFMLVAGLSAAVLAASSYLIVREARLSDSVDRALEQGRFNLVLAGETLGRNPTPTQTNELLAAYERRGTFVTVGRSGTRTFSSSLSLGPAQIPDELERLVAGGRLGYERTEVAGTRYLVVGGRVASADTELYYFFPEERLWDELGELRTILLSVLGGLVLLGGLVGAFLAIRRVHEALPGRECGPCY